ncbi:MAG: Asp-tRNA(Asn)/Glu-tRNA(Gln) amidotransferase subunit GatA [Candidatus Pacebacteria bacterium]|nr:Asp-tRNA(Asn)/Glu-tRNA(Gln) amidotransferase subunit GatA [Candidatus Paceibacterota bacterium]
MKLNELNIAEACEGLRGKKFSAVELTKAYLDRIDQTDEKIKSFITVTKDLAIEQAEDADKKIKSGDVDNNPLLGIPCSVKDVINTKGVSTTAASNILKNYIPAYDATLISRLKKDGMVMLGKVNCDAFAHGASTENSDFFTSHNPWDLDRVPGGSSGGSASSVSADQCLYSIGTDTGGSIRQPASFCNLVGLKPTYGRISRYGLISMTSSTDCPSIVAKRVNDVAIVLNKIAGKDERDSTSSENKVDNYQEFLKDENIKGMKIGIPQEYFVEGLNVEIKKAVENAVAKFESLGAEIVQMSLPHTKYAVPTYYIITPSEISSNLARFDGIRFGYSAINDDSVEAKNLSEIYCKSKGKGFGSEAKRRIMLGTYALSSGYYDAYYLKAQKVRALIKKDFDEAFEKVDVIITPTAPSVAFKIGEHSKSPLEMYMEDIFLSAVSLAGLPCVSVPCGFAKPSDGKNEIPIGMQIIGKYFDEKNILRLASVYEKNTDWHNIKPEFK